ncbi:MAG: polyprenyl synthetase family protein [Proteobacteria bacterium]|nr:polyprenyl synthetase family protein [Pseudomonadota bacterium]
MIDSSLGHALENAAARLNAHLDAVLSASRAPTRLVAAMRHAVFAGGKRMRPFLVIESARLFGVEGDAPLRVAGALEMVHCYSLAHDDLPAMDDDDLRRGQPTTHRAFDEATAILAGDALLTLAFSSLAARDFRLSAGKRIRLLSALAEASGMAGMVGGQMLDLAAEGRFDPTGTPPKSGARAIREIQSLKTGALIEFAAMAGAMLAPRAGKAERQALKTYGRALGLAFQIKDDLLDVEGDAAKVGKALAKDAEAGKATFVGLYGIAGARRELDKVSSGARQTLAAAFGNRAHVLGALLDFNQQREH